jgi:hypothetical protein
MRYFLQNIFDHWRAFSSFTLSPTNILVKKEWSFSVFYVAMITCICLMILGEGFKIIFAGFFHVEKSVIQNKDVIVLPNILILMVGGILAPLFEELSFRLPLKLSYRTIIVAFISSLIIFTFLSRSQILSIYNAQQISFSYYTIVIPVILLIALFLFKGVLLNNNRPFIYGLFVWTLALLFAISHGYENIYSIESFMFIFIISFTQLLAGLYYSFLRLQFSIRLSILIHCFWNTFLTLLIILFEK